MQNLQLDMGYLDSLSIGLPASPSGGFKDHPFGTFNGRIEAVKPKVYNNEKDVYDLIVLTSGGRVFHRMWGISNKEIMQSRNDEKARGQLLSNIATHKQLMVDLGIWGEEEAESKGMQAVFMAYGQVQGCMCKVIVKPGTHTKNGGIVRSTTVTKYQENFVDIVDEHQPEVQQSSGQQYGQQPPNQNQYNPGQPPVQEYGQQTPQGYNNSNPPGVGSMLDGIPF